MSKHLFKRNNQFAKGNPPNKTSFKEGMIPWNKGLKVRLNPKGEFKKGQHSSPNTEFKKGQTSGINNINWKGGIIKRMGYFYILSPSHPKADKNDYVKRANLIMEKIIGRFLNPKEIVHHINGIKTDDRPKNLQLFSNESKHQEFHHLFNLKIARL